MQQIAPLSNAALVRFIRQRPNLVPGIVAAMPRSKITSLGLTITEQNNLLAIKTRQENPTGNGQQ